MIGGWLMFVTLGEPRALERHAERRLSRDRLVGALNDLIDEQQALIDAQQEEIVVLRHLNLEEKRLARDVATLAVDALTSEPTPKMLEHLAEMARELGYSVARIEEHSA